MGLTVAALPVGGGLLAISPMPGRGCGLLADMADLRAFAPDLVLSMAPHSEMAAQGAAALPDLLAQAGVAWLHLPVADFGTPDTETEALWPAASARARGCLAGGGRVLVHCLGGCGRSGMAALRLMVETGEPAEAALDRLRAVRPCAVETGAQHQWATAVRQGADGHARPSQPAAATRPVSAISYPPGKRW